MITTQTLDDIKAAGPGQIRQRTHEALLRSQAFRALPEKDRLQISNDLVHTLSYLADPTAGRPELTRIARAVDAPVRGGSRATAGALAQPPPDSTEQLKQRLANEPKQVGKGFVGGAAREGGAVMAQYQKDVDFVGFVSGLIHGVFESIVSSSIRQMEAFGHLLEAVVKSVNEFANEDIGGEKARDYLAGKYPDALRHDRSDGASKLVMKDDVDDAKMPDFKSLLGLTDNLDVSDEDQEKQIVEAAQLKMARLRQQQLSTMVLMGINRIVVTEGEIKATVTFDVKSKDTAASTDVASMDDTQTHRDSSYEYQAKRDRSFWGTSSSASGSGSEQLNTRVSTAHADSKDTSESKLETAAKLTGFVSVKFKSETFPLERMASQTELDTVQERAAK
jgi:hypothetical protein